MRNSRIEVKPIAGALGAEIYGADIADDLDDDVIAQIRQALNEHCVIFFRDQHFDAEQHKAFARRFGDIFVHPNYQGMQDDDEIVMIRREPGDQHIVGEDWHADTTMMEEPPMGAILYALEVPPFGGDTLFANQYLAYEALSERMRAMLEGLKGVSNSAKADVTRTREDRVKSAGTSQAREALVAEHPVVRTHPETGRKAIYLNPIRIEGIEGMAEADALALLDELLEHARQPAYEYRHRWLPGDLVMWDNRCLLHKANGDYDMTQVRYLYRIMLQGEVPV